MSNYLQWPLYNSCLQHGVGMRWERIPQGAAAGSDGTLRRLDGGLVEIVFRLDVRSVDIRHLNRAGELLVFQFEGRLDGLVAMAADDVDHQRAIVERRGSIEIRYIVEPRAFVPGTVQIELERLALAVIGEQLQGGVNGLKEQGLLIGEDGGDDVDQLRHVGDLDDVRMIHKRVQEGCHHQGIFQVVVFFENAATALLRPAGAVPDVPLVPGNGKQGAAVR